MSILLDDREEIDDNGDDGDFDCLEDRLDAALESADKDDRAKRQGAK